MSGKKTTQAKQTAPLVRPWYHQERYPTPMHGESKTKPEFAPLANPNTIVQKYQQGQMIPQVLNAKYGNAPDQDTDFHRIQNAKAEINQSFEAMSPQERSKYGNSSEYLEHLLAGVQEEIENFDSPDPAVKKATGTPVVSESAPLDDSMESS